MEEGAVQFEGFLSCILGVCSLDMIWELKDENKILKLFR